MSRAFDLPANVVNWLLGHAGVMVVRAAPSQAESWRASIGGRYRSDREVITLARRAGLSVAEYIEQNWGDAGRRRQILEQMRATGAIHGDLAAVCEIGPGSGGYIQGVLETASPKHYEFYEIEEKRARWLSREFPVVMRPAHGESLAATADASVGLVHAHGVFGSLKVITCFAYFAEMARATKPGGHVCFDIIDDACLSDDQIRRFLESPLRYVNYLSQPLVVRFFAERGLELVDSFRMPLLIFGHSTYLIFRKSDV